MRKALVLRRTVVQGELQTENWSSFVRLSIERKAASLARGELRESPMKALVLKSVLCICFQLQRRWNERATVL